MDEAKVLRALRRLVYTDKLLTIEQAWRYMDVIGLPRAKLDDAPR